MEFRYAHWKRRHLIEDADIFKAVEETEDTPPHKPEGELAASLKAGLLMTMRAEVKSAVEAAKKEVLRAAVEETLRNIFLDGYEAGEEGV